MAEFCLDCWNRLNHTRRTGKDVRTEPDLCEGCGQVKPVIIVFRKRGPARWLEKLRVRLELWVCLKRG